MKVSPEFLKTFLSAQQKQYDFISLDDLVLLSEQNKKMKRKFIVMTFDYGYRDNYEYALPLFDKMRIPFTVYVTNSFPDTTVFLWWYVLEDILQRNNHVSLPDGRQFRCETKEEKENVFLSLRHLVLNLNQENLIEEFKQLFFSHESDYTVYNDKLCLSWSMIQEMADSKYCTIAAHTMNHKALHKVAEEQLEYEIVESKNELENHIQKSVCHFAYPFGTFNEVGKREVEFVKHCGFATASFSCGGGVTKNAIHKPLELPRQFLGELSR